MHGLVRFIVKLSLLNWINKVLFLFKGKKGQHVWTDGNDAEHISRGVYNTYTKRNLRYSQVAPLDMFTEKKWVFISN